MAILSKGPGKGMKKKDQPKSKIGTGKDGQTIAAPGYKMGLVRNQRDIKTPTKSVTTGSGPAAVTRTQQQGIIGPKPVAPAQKVAAAPKKKTAVGKAIKKVARDIDYAVGTAAYSLKPSVQKRGSFKGNKGGGKKGGKTCAAY